MLKTPNNQVLSSLVRLRSNEDFKQVVEWLEEELNTINRNMARCNGEDTIKHQGAALAVEAVLDTVDNAVSIAQKRKMSKESHS